jgi:hypothetical protein
LGYEESPVRWWAAGMVVVEMTSGVRLSSRDLAGLLPTLLYEDET